MTDNHPKITLNLSGLLCPLPVLKARKMLNAMASGDILQVMATDPMSAIDVPHFCIEQGHRLLEATNDGTTHIFRIRKK